MNHRYLYDNVQVILNLLKLILRDTFEEHLTYLFRLVLILITYVGQYLTEFLTLVTFSEDLINKLFIG